MHAIEKTGRQKRATSEMPRSSINLSIRLRKRPKPFSNRYWETAFPLTDLHFRKAAAFLWPAKEALLRLPSFAQTRQKVDLEFIPDMLGRYDRD
jgi:hypothetical protein